MNQYHLKLSLKTRVLNMFRRVFTIPLFEKVLVAMALKNSSGLIEKMIPPNYLYRRNSFRRITREGINYKLDIRDSVDHYLYYGFKDTGYDAVLDEIKNAKVILDIGANIGTTALYFASVNPVAQVLAFEPHPGSFVKASENIAINNFKNIQIVNSGLGEKKSTLKLYEVNENNPGMNRIIAEEKDLPFKNIEVVTLVEECRARGITQIDFIKLDVEGFEYSVLVGGKEIIQRSKPTLYIELDDDNLRENNKSAKALLELLISFGYKQFYRADSKIPVTLESQFEHCHFDMVAK